jgi:hypothetical protein
MANDTMANDVLSERWPADDGTSHDQLKHNSMPHHQPADNHDPLDEPAPNQQHHDVTENGLPHTVSLVPSPPYWYGFTARHRERHGKTGACTVPKQSACCCEASPARKRPADDCMASNAPIRQGQPEPSAAAQDP